MLEAKTTAELDQAGIPSGSLVDSEPENGSPSPPRTRPADAGSCTCNGGLLKNGSLQHETRRTFADQR